MTTVLFDYKIYEAMQRSTLSIKTTLSLSHPWAHLSLMV
jgi:hypothetical protein